MFGRGFTIGTLFGLRIRIDFSWFIIAALLVWSLSVQYFPTMIEEMGGMLGIADDAEVAPSTYWLMGILGTLGLFLSVLLHELSHALMARRFGIEMRGITLFIFGGVAEMNEEPPSPRAEFEVAIAGPILSFVLGLACIAALLLQAVVPLPPEAIAVLAFLGMMNVLLALFNLVPAFPLDGGRILRAAIWHFKDDLRYATSVTSKIGAGFGIFLIVLGAFMVIGQNWAGVWYILIGLFVRHAAQMSYQQLLLRRGLEGEVVARFMKEDPVTVPRILSIRELVESFVYKYHYKMFPVVDEGRLVGCVTTQQIKELSQDEWDNTTVGALADACSPTNSIPPDEDAMDALSLMSREGLSRLLVVEDGRLRGILTLKDLLDFLSLKIELENP